MADPKPLTPKPTVQSIRLGRLRPNPDNPRVIKPERMEHLKQILQADPDMLNARPLIALPTGIVIAGNQRYLALMDLHGPDLHVPTYVVELDRKRQHEWTLRDNEPFGEWVEDALGEILAEFRTEGWDTGLIGFEDDRIAQILGENLGNTKPDADPNELPAMPMEAQSVRGEVYECGPHRVMCGDSSDPGDVATLVGADIAVMVLADPPYNVAYTGGKRAETNLANPRQDTYDDAMPLEAYRDFLAATLKNAAGASTDDAALHLWFADRRVRQALEALDRGGWEMRAMLVWNKLNATYGDLGAQYKARHESFFYAHKRGKTPRWHGASNEVTVWDYDKPKNSELHPVMRPVELYERALQNHTHTGDLVLELFGGSGTTMIAAERTGRRALVMEIDPRYVDVIRQRYADYTGAESGLRPAETIGVKP